MKVWLSMLASSSVHDAIGAAVVFHCLDGTSPMFARLLQGEGGSQGRGPMHATIIRSTSSLRVSPAQQQEKHTKVQKLASQATPTTGALAPRTQGMGIEHQGSGQVKGEFGSQGFGTGSGPSLVRSSIDDLDYTADALRVGFQGKVVVDVMIDENGKVVQARLLNPTGFDLDTQVMAVAEAARYMPAVGMDGQPVKATAKLNFDFKIPR